MRQAPNRKRTASQCHAKRPASQSHGQALTEFLVLAVAILPMFLLVPLIGKYQDVAHSTQMASRFLAFDAANRDPSVPAKDEAQLAAEVRRRYFGMPDGGIESEANAAGGPGDADTPVNPFWTNPHGGALIRSATDVAISFGPAEAAQATQAYMPASDGAPFNLAPLANASRAGLPTRGIYRANVTVPLVNLPAGHALLEPFDSIKLRIARQTSVLTDAWTASGPDQVQSRSGQLAAPIPGLGLIETVVALAMPVVDLNAVQPPRFGRLDAWRDVVPGDRLLSADPN
jgi:hypothetical protein